jgi:hypothetical protein
MRVMEVGRQSMYDTFGDKRALFLKALELYVTESVHSVNVELQRPGSALSAIQNALVTFAERKDLSVFIRYAIVATKDIQNAMNALEKNDGTLMEPDARLAQR